MALVNYSESLLLQIQQLRLTYLRSGGRNPALLSQITDAEMQASMLIAKSNNAVMGGRHPPYTVSMKLEPQLPHEKDALVLPQYNRQQDRKKSVANTKWPDISEATADHRIVSHVELLGFEVISVKYVEQKYCKIRLTAYHCTSGQVVQSSSGPVNGVTSSAHAGVFEGRHIFREQTSVFKRVDVSEDMILVVRLYSCVDTVNKLTECNDSEFSLTAWTFVPLVIRDKQHQTAVNVGTHKLQFYHPPLPDVSQLGNGVRVRQKTGLSASITLRVFVNNYSGSPERRADVEESGSESEDPADPPWILVNRIQPAVDPFTSNDGFDLFIDGCRFLPDSVTITRVAARVMDRQYNCVGQDMSTISHLESSVHHPVFAFRAEFRERNLPPTATLLIKIYTIDNFTKNLVIVGYSTLNVFVEMGTERQPLADTGVQVSLNEGGHQLRIYRDVPDSTAPLCGKCLENKRIVPCASVLVRLFKATTDYQGQPLNATNIPRNNWPEHGLNRSMPLYNDAFYYSNLSAPTKGEQQLFRRLSKRTSPTVRELAVALCQERGDVIGQSLEDYVRMLLNRLLDRRPEEMSLTFVAPYNAGRGFKFALDEAINLPWNNFTHAHLCVNPPGVYYTQESDHKSRDQLQFTELLDVSSTNRSPRWLDGFAHFRNRVGHPYLSLIVHLKELTVVSTADSYKYKLLNEAWTVLTVLSNGYACHAYYQLPLFHGSPTGEMLEALSGQLAKDWIIANLKTKKTHEYQEHFAVVLTNLLRNDQCDHIFCCGSVTTDAIQLVDTASILVRLCDGDRDDEIPRCRLENVMELVDTSHMPPEKLHNRTPHPDEMPLSALVPQGNNPSEFLHKLGNRFRNLVQKLDEYTEAETVSK